MCHLFFFSGPQFTVFLNLIGLFTNWRKVRGSFWGWWHGEFVWEHRQHPQQAWLGCCWRHGGRRGGQEPLCPLGPRPVRPERHSASTWRPATQWWSLARLCGFKGKKHWRKQCEFTTCKHLITCIRHLRGKINISQLFCLQGKRVNYSHMFLHLTYYL